jgi:superfamily I DNA and/or RNA helicase
MQDSAEAGIHLQPKALNFFKRTFKNLMGDFMSLTDQAHIVISTCNNSAYFKETKMKFPLILIDDAAAALDADIAVTLQIEHDSLVLLGDHTQGKPVVGSKGRNESWKCMSQSLFERSMRSSGVVTTTLL